MIEFSEITRLHSEFDKIEDAQIKLLRVKGICQMIIRDAGNLNLGVMTKIQNGKQVIDHLMIKVE